MPHALVTGGASGLGLEAAAVLAANGFSVVIADRNVDGGRAAVERIRAATRGDVQFRPLDLASLADVRRFVSEFRQQPLDLLVNNAGILPSLDRQRSADGHELTLAIALLGHFALTGLLLPALQRSATPRVVHTSSLASRWGRLAFDDLHAARSYEPQTAYNQSKLAVLMFALELDARARRAGLPLQSLAAHPGISRTAIGNARLQEAPRRLRDRLEMWAFRAAMSLAGQSAAEGARPILYAALAPEARGGEFYGPGGFQEWSGAPKRVAPPAAALDTTARARLWQESERLTGVPWPI